jgi:GNAT superfamily N-acetyltransferase
LSWNDVRAATAADAETIAVLLMELVEELVAAGDVARLRARMPGDVADGLRDSNVRFFVQEFQGRAAGIARADILHADPIFRLRADPRCGYVDQMYVRPRARGRGFGRALLCRCEAWFREEGVGHVLLHSAPHALPFYVRLGYETNREMVKAL